MRAQLLHLSVAVMLIIAIFMLPDAAAQPPSPPPPPPPAPLTAWCQTQKSACETTCKELGPQSVSTDFKCFDEGISTTTSTRSVQCACLDAAGNILSSSTLGGGAGAAVISVGGSSSSSSSASGGASSGR